MINETVFIVGACSFIVLAIYHMVGLPLARDIGFFLPIKTIAFSAPIIIVVALLQAMTGSWGWSMYVALTLALVYMALLAEALHLLLPKRAALRPFVRDSEVVPNWGNHIPDDDRFTHG